MRFKLVKTGKRYVECQNESQKARHPDATGPQENSSTGAENLPQQINKDSVASPVIWRGTAQEYRSMLVVRQAELVAAKAQLTGNNAIDWYVNNKIADLEMKIADLRKWLAEEMGKGNEF